MKRCSVPQLMLYFFFAFLAVAAMAGIVIAVAPNVIFNSQNPADINSTNLLTSGLNITYNISGGATLNVSSIRIYLRTNTSTDDCISFINGTSTCGFQSYLETTRILNTSYFEIPHRAVYPGVYNFNQSAMASLTKLQYSLPAITYYAKTQFLNVSTQDSYNYLFVNAQNTSSTTADLRIYYCNASYTTGDPSTSSYCANFYSLPDTTPYTVNYSNSKYYLIPFAINNSTGGIDGVKVSNTSYFLFRGRPAPNNWIVSYISNISRPGATQYSTNSGGTWTNLAGTYDVHLHQFSDTDTLYYYVCANDTSNNQNCSSTRSDLLQLSGLPPDGPIIHSPTIGNYSGNITINYSAAQSPNGYAISFYNITLMNSTDDYVMTIKSNNSINLSYVWNSTVVPDGDYNVHVTACDINSQCSLAESNNFIIDNTPPQITITSPTARIYSSNPVTFSISANEGLSSCWYTLNNWTTNKSLSSTTNPKIFKTTTTLANGLYTAKFLCKDYAGNANSSQEVSFGVSAPSTTSSGGGSSTITIQNIGNISITNKTVTLAANNAITFDIENQTHFMRVTQIDTAKKTVLITLLSNNEINVSLKENQPKNIDLNGDSKYDITVTLMNITSSGQAEINIKKYVPPSNVISGTGNATNQTSETQTSWKWDSSWDIYIWAPIAAGILVLIILGLVKKAPVFKRNSR